LQQPEIEMILMRQLASCLRMPILIVDPNGDLLFFNEAAEQILGRRFEETGTIRRGEWSGFFQPTNDDGSPVPREEQPLYIATERRCPAHRRSWIRALDGSMRRIEGVAFPILASQNRCLGAAGIFWELE
jgi:PAS domain-containing protein